MSRLVDYRSALLATFPDADDGELTRVLDEASPDFISFVIDHGLGPLWHERTNREEFHQSRLSAEALFLAQEHALAEIDTVLEGAGIEYLLIKGAASRLLLYDNPAIRACYDLDLLVSQADRVRAASVLVQEGFALHAKSLNISHQLVLSRGVVDIDLHWGLLREGRLRRDFTDDMLSSRRREHDVWMLSAEDALFVHLVHPAFAKHLSGWGMGLHRVMDIGEWLRKQSFDWQVVNERLEQNGVRTAAWATLRWVELLTHPHVLPGLKKLMDDLRPGQLRRTWLDRWFRSDLSERTSHAHWARLLFFSTFLHDAPADALRALAGRFRARRESEADLEAFQGLFDQ